jgi:hypothetical protein
MPEQNLAECVRLPPHVSPRRDFFFALAVVGSMLTATAAVTWRRWPDMLVDFGLQLYIPWKLSSGAVLYRDVAYMTGGPFSQYYDALVFRVFGVSILTLVVSNLAILVVVLGLVYRSFYQAADQLTAIVACLAIVLVFAFGHYGNYGVFNYITPYSQEVYHGLVLSVLAVVLLAQWAGRQKAGAALAAGFCWGLVFLTKPEIFLAVAVTVGACLCLVWRMTLKVQTAGKGLGMMTLGGVIPVLAFLLYFLHFENLRNSLRWTCWAWTPLLTTSAASSPLYRWCLGLDGPGFHVRRMVVHFLGVMAIVIICALLLRRRTRRRDEVIAWVLVAAPLAVLAWHFDWVDCGRCLPLLCASLLALLLWRAQTQGWNQAAVFPILWTIFSLGLLAKLGFFCRIWHYGFALAMPAFMSAIYLLLVVLPQMLEKRGVRPELLRALACLLLAIGFVQLLLVSKYVYQWKTVPVGEGGDKLWTFRPQFEPTGSMMGQALSWMKTNSPADSTVAVLPAGAMLNYLLRRTNPTGYLRWNPPELAVFGQSNMTRAFAQRPPDYIILMGVDNSEFGVRFLGDNESFGLELMRWINGAYQPACLIGDDWMQNGKFGIKILKRK